MKRGKFINITLISITLFTIFFLTLLVRYSDIVIMVNSFFKDFSKDYYDWFMSNTISSEESSVIDVSFIFKMVFSLVFLLEYLYFVSTKKYRQMVGDRFIVISTIIGIVVYAISFLVIKYIALHYRLYMYFISTTVLAMVLLSLIIRAKKASMKG